MLHPARFIVVSLALVALFCSIGLAAEPVRVGVFDIDASPPVGTPMAYDPTKGIQTPLSCRGVVIVAAGKPIVMVAVDWIGIGNSGHTVFRARIARAVGCDANRVVVHTLHQHDAPRLDFDADEMLRPFDLPDVGFNNVFARDVIQRAATAAKKAMDDAKPVTHLGLGEGVVEKVASNRRILGEDGKVKHIRWTATKDPVLQAFPAGVIDPKLKMISFWNGEKAIAALTYYATHPQSYYRTGMASPDFPGLARNARQDATGVPHIHFNGAGGNIGAGKWNDGSKANRQVLADRVAAGMERAWENTTKSELSANDLGWRVEPTALPVAKHLSEESLIALVKNKDAKPTDRWYAAKKLTWLRRCQRRDPIDITCLRVKQARILHLPGELFVEYQLAAQKLRPDLFVAMAAYGDYAPGYIGTKIAYGQGGYETSERALMVAPEVEEVLMSAIKKLLSPSEQ